MEHPLICVWELSSFLSHFIEILRMQNGHRMRAKSRLEVRSFLGAHEWAEPTWRLLSRARKERAGTDQFGTGSKAIRSRVHETRAVSWTQGHRRKKGKKRGGGIRDSSDRCSPVLLPTFMAPNSAKIVAGYLPSHLHARSKCINKLTSKAIAYSVVCFLLDAICCRMVFME